MKMVQVGVVRVNPVQVMWIEQWFDDDRPTTRIWFTDKSYLDFHKQGIEEITELINEGLKDG